jgi:hypothetical protein
MSLGNDRALLSTRHDTCVAVTVTNLAAGLGESIYNDKSKHVYVTTTTAPSEDAESGAKARLGPYCSRLAQKAQGCCSSLTDIRCVVRMVSKCRKSLPTPRLVGQLRVLQQKGSRRLSCAWASCSSDGHGGVNCPSPAKLLPAELREKLGPMMHMYSTWVRALASVSCISKCQGIKPLSTPH